MQHGSNWTVQEVDRIKTFLDQGLSPHSIALRLRSEGCARTYEAVTRYVNKVKNGDHKPPVDADTERWIRGDNPPVDEPVNTVDSVNTPRIVGIIGDTHIPFTHPDYLDFCKGTFADYGVNEVVHIGDLVDNHAISYHEADPDGMSAGDELEASRAALKPWFDTFPRVKWVTGNHDKLPGRKAHTHGIPRQMLRRNIYGIPDTWENAESFEIDGVLYCHGIGAGGINGHRVLAQKRGMSCVIGHLHTSAGVAYTATHSGLQRFGLNVGCGIDHKSYAMEYAKEFGRPTLGCGVVIDGKYAAFVPMLGGE